MHKGGHVYIMTNKYHTALYIGVTSDLLQRVSKHKLHEFKNSFTDKYNIEYLVHYEEHGTIEIAIMQEREIKKWRREKKNALIECMNPDWKHLCEDLL
jgi:putative endonuclease